MQHNTVIYKSVDGYAAMTTMIIVLTVSLAITGGFVFFTIQEVQTNRVFTKSIESLYISESGIEDAAYRIATGKIISSGELLGVGNGTTTITITTSENQRTIRSEGVRSAIQKNLESRIDITTAAVNFFYGLQIGDGGLTMNNNSRVNGSIYSNGSIIGNVTGAVITGDALVAVVTPPVVNQSWTVQNADLPVGIATGSITVIVDSAGDVGSYTSLALGSDGFGRISYIDNTNSNDRDLKFARCTSDACTTSARAAVDTAGDVNEVTSIVVGADDFARVSYYHDGNDDLKFARCPNDNCTSPTLTLVDGAGNMGDFSSVKMGSDGFARIAYWDDSNKDVEFARCTNANCTTKVLTTVESASRVGEYISLALGSDGFARMGYYDDTTDDLKFARCTNADCTAKVITSVDTTGDVGKYTSLALGSDGFGRISYYDDTGDDLKFARCTNADCTSRTIATVESAGTIGHYTSLALGSDGFARISYYDSSNGDLKFARCLNDDCTSAKTSRVDNGSSVGKYNSLALGSDGFGRISYYAQTAGDLKFARCFDADCTPQSPHIDVAQSFQPTITDRVAQIDLFLKKVGSPANAILRIVRDSGGSPSTNPSDVLATATISAAAIGGSYAWISLPLSLKPTLTANTSYWMVIDASLDNGNYFFWGLDSAAGYTRGSAKRTADWTLGGWAAVTGDLDFKVYMGGTDTSLEDVTVGGRAQAHTVDNVDVTGNVDAFSYNDGTIGGTVRADSISNCTVSGNAHYNTKTSCTISGTETTPTTPPADLPRLDMPIPDSVIQGWKNDAASGGTCVAPQCDASGDYILINGGTGTLGPKKITGKLKLDNGAVLTVSGMLWVVGNIELSNNCIIRLSPSYGAFSGVIITDSITTISNNCTFQGSGNPASYIVLISEKNTPGSDVITVDNNSAGVVYYADSGRIKFSNNATAKEATAYGITMDNGAEITYESGLADLKFSSGPGGGYNIQHWKEVE